MKMMKKIAVLMLAICLVVPCFSFLSQAADGQIMFTDHTDPAVETGSTVEVTGVVNKTNSTMGKIEITMTYDAELLKFKSGDGTTKVSDGTLKYTGDATSETGSRKEFKMTFEALKAGTATIKISDAVVKNVSGATMEYTKGSSTIKITGEAVTGTVDEGSLSEGTVEIDGKTYHFSNDIPLGEIPKGYEESTLEYDLKTYKVVYSEDFGLSLAYLVNEDNEGDFFMYVEETATFAPYEAIEISEETTIVVLTDVSEVVLPEEYKAMTVPFSSGYEFPAWQTDDTPGYCVFYALNNHGETGLYQYDSEEGTYQRFTAPSMETEKEDNSFIGKLSQMLEKHLDYVILGAGFSFILFVLIIVILSVKLYNRNAELDEIYDEYGIDTDDEKKTDDDFILSYDLGAGDANEDEEDEFESDVFVQDDLTEIFPEEDEVDVDEVASTEDEPMESIDSIAESMDTDSVMDDNPEDTLGAVLAQQMSNDTSTDEDDDDVLLEEFTMDFIDLDD